MPHVESFNYSGNELSLLQRFSEQSALFSLVSPEWTIIGYTPEQIIQSWSGVEQWFNKKLHNSRDRSRPVPTKRLRQKTPLPFTHGLIGYLSYEQGYRFITPPSKSILKQPKQDTLNLPDVYFGEFKNLVLFHKPSKKIYVVYTHKGFLKDVKKILGQNTGRDVACNVSTEIINSTGKNTKNILSQSQYKKSFNTIKNHIQQGDIYQANLSYRLNFPYTQSPINAFTTLYSKQPTPYSACIQTPKFSIASNSPELFLKIKDNLAETRPMKGTRPRGNTSADDKRLQQELLHSIKDQAELDMIIDLHRNDLNRTAIPGTTTVKTRRRLTKYNTVWQTDSVIQSTIAEPYTSLDVIKTCFPAGSITGAPKIRAMEILHELEPNRRNIYTGSIGYIDHAGNLELNVAIRTAVIKQQQLYYSVGGGIVFDSDSHGEYIETLVKAKTIRENF